MCGEHRALAVESRTVDTVVPPPIEETIRIAESASKEPGTLVARFKGLIADSLRGAADWVDSE